MMWAASTWDEVRTKLGIEGHEFPHQPIHGLMRLSEHVDFGLDEFDAKIKEHLLSQVQRAMGDIGEFAHRHTDVGTITHFLKKEVVDHLIGFKDELWDHVVKDRCNDTGLRVFFTTFDTFVSAVAGVLAEDVLSEGFLSVDHQELTEFLRAHGATPFTLDMQQSPFLRGWYDAAFAYDCDQRCPPPRPGCRYRDPRHPATHRRLQQIRRLQDAGRYGRHRLRSLLRTAAAPGRVGSSSSTR